MLKIGMEFRKGILFVRLNGVLDKDNIKRFKRQVTSKIFKNGIRNVVFNIEYLKEIDIKGINELLYNYELCSKNNGKLLICGVKDDEIGKKLHKYHLLSYYKKIETELTAYDVIKI